MRQGILVGKRGEGADQTSDHQGQGSWQRSLYPAAHGSWDELCLSVPSDPVGETRRIPASSDCVGQPRQSGLWILAGPLELIETLFNALIQLETETEERQDPIRIVIMAAELPVSTYRGGTSALEDSPAPGTRKQALEQVLTTELAGEV